MDIGYVLPKEYINFIKITNGAVLFKDDEYGQWGFEFLPIGEMKEVSETIRKIGYELPESSFVVARCYGDGDVIVIDTVKAKNNEAYVIDGDEGYVFDKWKPIARKFDDFVDRLIVAQGAKYWRWY